MAQPPPDPSFPGILPWLRKVFMGPRNPPPLRPIMGEKDYLQLRNEFLKERWVRLVQGWFVAFLAVILVGCVIIILEYRFGRPDKTVFIPSTYLMNQKLSIGIKERDPKMKTDATYKARVTELKEIVDGLEVAERKASEEQSKSESENKSWARTTITALIGFITGYISARRNKLPGEETSLNSGQAGDGGQAPPPGKPVDGVQPGPTDPPGPIVQPPGPRPNPGEEEG